MNESTGVSFLASSRPSKESAHVRKPLPRWPRAASSRHEGFRSRPACKAHIRRRGRRILWQQLREEIAVIEAGMRSLRCSSRIKLHECSNESTRIRSTTENHFSDPTVLLDRSTQQRDGIFVLWNSREMQSIRQHARVIFQHRKFHMQQLTIEHLAAHLSQSVARRSSGSELHKTGAARHTVTGVQKHVRCSTTIRMHTTKKATDEQCAPRQLISEVASRSAFRFVLRPSLTSPNCSKIFASSFVSMLCARFLTNRRVEDTTPCGRLTVGGY